MGLILHIFIFLKNNSWKRVDFGMVDCWGFWALCLMEFGEIWRNAQNAQGAFGIARGEGFIL